MKVIYIVLIFSLFGIACESGKESTSETEAETSSAEATSFLGKPLTWMEFSAETKARLDSNLQVAKDKYVHNPNNEENIIWYGRRLAYLTRYRDAIEVYSDGIEALGPTPKLLRHRGHRYISVRELDKAVADLKEASELISGTEDEIEPDGAPNRLNIPLSTLHFNIWYHLGLAYYLQGDFDNALEAYEECMIVSKNPDLLVATSDWYYMTLRRLGMEEDADKLISAVPDSLEIIENESYFRRISLYKGLTDPAELINLSDTTESRNLNLATQGYGVGNWYLYEGDTAKAIEIFQNVVDGSYWPAFGYIAAEADLARLQAVEE